jgi:hypothetical protein
MIARFAQWQGRKPESIAADASYGNGEFLQWLMDREITPYMPTRNAVARTRSPFYGPEYFTYLPESNSYMCPAGQQLNYVACRLLLHTWSLDQWWTPCLDYASAPLPGSAFPTQPSTRAPSD